MMCFITTYKTIPVIIINLVNVEMLHNLLEAIKTCSASHTGSIRINALRGGHIHTHTYVLTSQTKAILYAGLWPGSKTVYEYEYTCMYV